MTRETKLGLVVAGSLMCLLGALIGRKLLFEEPAVPDPHEQIVAKNETPAAPAQEKKQVDPIIAEPKKHSLQNGNFGEILPVKGTTGNKTEPDPKNGANSAKDLKGLQPPQVDPVVPELAKQKNLGGFAKPPLLITPPALPGMPPGIPEPVSPEQLAQLIPKPMPQGPEIPPGIPPELPEPKTSIDPKTGKPPLVDPNEPLPPSLPVPGSISPAPVPPEPGKNNVPEIKVKTSTGGIPDVPPPPPLFKEPSKNIPESPPMPLGSGSTKLPETSKGTVPVIDIGTLPPPVEVKKKEPDPAEQQGLPQVNVKDFGKTPEPPMPPLGAAPPVKLDPMPIPMAPTPVEPKKQIPTGPVVSEYEDEIYQCQPDALTFSDISKKYYRSESFADALLMYNRNHPNGPSSIKQDPPQLQVGQTVYIPPTIILETRYSQAIKNFKPLPQTPAIEIKPPVVAKTPETPAQGSQSLSLGNGGPPPIKVTEKSGLHQTLQGLIYEVKTGNEMLLEIARQTLGDSRRWSEIYRLNPGINPAYPLPIGTQLKLPGTAKANP